LYSIFQLYLVNLNVGGTIKSFSQIILRSSYNYGNRPPRV